MSDGHLTESSIIPAASIVGLAAHLAANISAVHGTIFLGTEQTGTDVEQNQAHGLGGTPTKAVALVTGRAEWVGGNLATGGILSPTTDLLVAAPTTPSTQASGVGATEWRVNIGAGDSEIIGFQAHANAAADTVLHDTDQLIANGEEIYAVVVRALAGGVTSTTFVLGTAAAIGAATIPTAAQIFAAVGSNVKLAVCYLKRTADTTLVQTQDNTVRRAWGCTITAGVHDGTNCKFTVSLGYKYRVLAWR